MVASQRKDKDGHHWIVEKDGGCTQLDVWWNRTTKRFRGQSLTAELLVIRQDREDQTGADTVCLQLGQVYDLIDALNKAVDNP
jgi:hypothetical protein